MILAPPNGTTPADPKVDRALVRGVTLARVWAAALENGEVASVKALARRNGLCHNYTARLLPLAYLAPDLVEIILDGRQPGGLTLAKLIERVLPTDWTEQRALFAR